MPGPEGMRLEGEERMVRSVSPLVTVRSPEYAILGQTVHLYCNFTLPTGHEHFYSLKVRSGFHKESRVAESFHYQ